MSDVFSDNTNETHNDPNFLDQLVGEGKKFKSVEDLARGKAESDRYVDQLRTELETERKLNQDKLDRLLKSLENKSTTPASGPSSDSSSNPTNDGRPKDMSNTNSNDASGDIESLVKKALRDQQDLTRKEANLQVVNTKLDELFGEKANVVVREKAKELEVPLEQLKAMAETSPLAFLTLIGGQEKASTSFSSKTGKVNSEALGVSKPNNENGWSYYKALKKSNPSEFWKRHGEIYEKVQLMGHDKFYNS